MVDGRAFFLEFFPKGHSSCKGTHISVSLHRFEIDKQMKLDLPISTEYKFELIHKSDETKNFIREY